MSKLPSDVQLQISHKSTNEVWKIDAWEANEGAKSSVVENRKPPINPKQNNGSILLSANALVAKGPEEF